MVVCAVIAKRRGYPVSERLPAPRRQKRFFDALPSLLLVIIVMGGILGGIFYRYRSVGYRRGLHLYPVGAHLSGSEMARSAEADPESVVMTSIVLLLIGFSVGMSWAMTNADIPYMISDALMGVSETRW